MDELKPCPLDEARKILWYCAQFTDNTHWKNQYRRALTAICDELDCRPTPENKPLTLEELRQMDGKPVYLVINDGESTLEMWVLVCVDDVNHPKDKPVVLRNSAGGHDLFFNDKELEQERIHVYARKPEGSEAHGEHI